MSNHDMTEQENQLWSDIVTSLVRNNKPYRLVKDEQDNTTIDSSSMEAIIHCANSAVVGRRNFNDRLVQVSTQAEQEQDDSQ